MVRLGYYSAVPETAKEFMSAAEWNCWYDGKEAVTHIEDHKGNLQERAGHMRDVAAIGIGWRGSPVGTRLCRSMSTWSNAETSSSRRDQFTQFRFAVLPVLTRKSPTYQ